MNKILYLIKGKTDPEDYASQPVIDDWLGPVYGRAYISQAHSSAHQPRATWTQADSHVEHPFFLLTTKSTQSLNPKVSLKGRLTAYIWNLKTHTPKFNIPINRRHWA